MLGFIKNLIPKKKEEKRESIATMIITKYPGAYLEYYESLGFKVDSVPTKSGKFLIVVWDREIKEKERAEMINKLREVV
jgi:hypothetical protein